jgi:hypothetical protein
MSPRGRRAAQVGQELWDGVVDLTRLRWAILECTGGWVFFHLRSWALLTVPCLLPHADSSFSLA